MKCHDNIVFSKDNPFIQRLIEEIEIDPNEAFPNDGFCEFCDQKEATTLCSTCNQIFCENCQRGHKRLRFALHHEFISLQQYDPKKKIKTCQIHHEQELSIYCQSCKENICPMCSTSNHKVHDTFILKDFIHEIQHSINISKEKVIFSIFQFSIFNNLII